MRRILTTTLLAFVFLLFYENCVNNPEKNPDPGTTGNLKIVNQSGMELSIYVDQSYKGIVKKNKTLTIQINNVEAGGTKIEVDIFMHDRLTDLSRYPSDMNARYYSFLKVVKPLNDPEPVIPIYIPALSSDDLSYNTGIVPAMVRFSYYDIPQITSAVTIITGSVSNPKIIARLEKGGSIRVPMLIGFHSISVEYNVAGFRESQRKVYPQNNNQKDDIRFVILLSTEDTDVEYKVPPIGDIFNVSFVNNEMIIGDPIIQ